jgi:hypothetical protein
MEAINKFANYLQSLPRKKFQQYLLMSLGCIAASAGLLIYAIHEKKASLIQYTIDLGKLSAKSAHIIGENRKMTIEEQRIREIIDKNKGFAIKSFFEQFCREKNINPEPGWGDTHVEPINERFDEVILSATFKDLTTKNLIKILSALAPKDIVTIQELRIRTQQDKKITVDITLASKKLKIPVE